MTPFPAYGDGGDVIGSRRIRRAFRFSVAAAVLFTAMLWYADRYLRYDEQAERLFVTGLMHSSTFGRPFLRAAVRWDEERHEFPTPKYLEALALREESDKVLPTYEKAFKLDPGNASLAIQYGCRLFLANRAAEARERFRDAAAAAPTNALAMYLEAAVLPWANNNEETLAESLALVAKANSGGRKVSFPRPLWSSDLPQTGWRYAELCRQMVDECCRPIVKYKEYVMARAEADIAAGQTQNWLSWLETLQTMGERFWSDAAAGVQDDEEPTPGSSLQAEVGMSIQLAALQLRSQAGDAEPDTADLMVKKRCDQLIAALSVLNRFKEASVAAIGQDMVAQRFPLLLCLQGMFVLGTCYAVACMATKFARADRAGWTLTHSSVGKVVLVGGASAATGVLFLAWLAKNTVGASAEGVMKLLWWTVIVGTIGFGLIYPRLRLPDPYPPVSVETTPDTSSALLREARRRRRNAYAVLLRRYYGIALGLLVIGACVWTLGHRASTSVYPWQIELLTTGLEQEEARVVRQAASMLR